MADRLCSGLSMNAVHLRVSATSVQTANQYRRTVALPQVSAAAARIVGAPVPAAAPLMQAGMDSLGAVELRRELAAVLGAWANWRTLVTVSPGYLSGLCSMQCGLQDAYVSLAGRGHSDDLSIRELL